MTLNKIGVLKKPKAIYSKVIILDKGKYTGYFKLFIMEQLNFGQLIFI